MFIVLSIIWIHYIADFQLQSQSMSMKKSSSNKWLLYHVSVYSTPFLIFGWKFAAVTFLFHFATDWVTSRCTTALYKKQEWHWFFCVIGFDQAIHMTTLLLTYHFSLAKNLEWL